MARVSVAVGSELFTTKVEGRDTESQYASAVASESKPYWRRSGQIPQMVAQGAFSFRPPNWVFLPSGSDEGHICLAVDSLMMATGAVSEMASSAAVNN